MTTEQSAHESDVPHRAFVLGFDGVPWQLLRDWVMEGELPTFARLFEEGATGPLDSTRPATTALAWPSIFSGMEPDQHGIYAFRQLTSDYSRRMNTSAEVTGPQLWDLLEPAVVGNVPMTYPATEIDGRMVSSMMTPSMDHQVTYPDDLKPTIREEIPDYQISLDYSEYGTDQRDAFVRDLDQMVDARRELLSLLMDTDDWRLFSFVFTAPDRLQHLIWDEAVLLQQYKTLDDILADVLHYIETRDATLYVVSDHGFCPIESLLHVNVVLEEAGFVVRRTDDGVRGILDRLGISRNQIRRLLGYLHISEEELVDRLPRSLIDSVAATMPGDHGLYDIDYNRTTAFYNSTGTIFVNDTERFDHGIVSPAEKDRVIADLRTTLESVTDSDGKQALTVFDGRDLFPRDPRSPDLVVESDSYVLQSSLADQVFQPADMAASHDPEGIFLAWGPDIEPGTSVEGASVFDVAPTVLHGVGEPIPDTVDGQVLDAIFASDSPTAERGVEIESITNGRGTESPSVQDEFDTVEERLQGLGYMK